VCDTVSRWRSGFEAAALVLVGELEQMVCWGAAPTWCAGVLLLGFVCMVCLAAACCTGMCVRL
jgi:hypothetical protein